MKIEWYQKIKPRVHPVQIKIHTFKPDVLLVLAGYDPMPNGSYTRVFDNEHRFHCYIESENLINIHTDLFKVHPDGRIYHVASTYKAKPERKRIRSLIFPDKQKRDQKVKRNVYLPRAEYVEAMRALESGE